MIRTFSTTIRRKEMDAVLTCMVDEKIGPGELNTRFIQAVKDFTGCDGAVALRTPETALKYALRSLDFAEGETVMISALAPAWHYQAVVDLGYKPLVLDVDDATGLVNAEIVQRGINHGGRLLLLHESMGIMPEMDAILALNIPVIEDISKSAGAVVPVYDANGTPMESVKAGSYGVYTILTLEEKDVITAGGGAVLIAPKRREWIVLKKFVDEMPKTELLPDINSALAWVQIKEFKHNEISRKTIYSLYQRACMSGRHKLYARNIGYSIPDNAVQPVNTSGAENAEQDLDFTSTMSAFPLILTSSYKDVKQYAAKKDIEISQAYEDSVIALKQEELSDSCIRAKSLYLRCALFPLYPRLTHSQVSKIVKVLGSLP